MNNRQTSDVPALIKLNTPAGAPFIFTAIIKQPKAIDNSACLFEVTCHDAETGSIKTQLYKIDDREHKSYLQFFRQLSRDFALRLPQNHQPAIRPPFNNNYREVLCNNLVPGMLYGYGDPCVMRVAEDTLKKKELYYLVVTSNDASDSFPICRSKDLINWEFAGFVFPKGQKPEWAADGEGSDYWAPEMHQIGNEYRVYFAARSKENFELCIGVARSFSPEGPFVADKKPILQGNTIDPHIFFEDNENSFLFWKEDNNGVWPGRLVELLYTTPSLTKELFPDEKDQITASFIITLWPWIQTLKYMEAFLVQHILIEAVISEFSVFMERLKQLSFNQPSNVQKKIDCILQLIRTPVYVQKLTPDGSALSGERKKVIENTLEWEAHLVEGMWVTKHSERYYLFYSANDFSTEKYGTGVAIASSLLGPYTKMSKPLLQSSKEWWAPGHPCVVKRPDGKFQLFVHAYFPGKAGYKEFRALLTMPVELEKDQVRLTNF